MSKASEWAASRQPALPCRPAFSDCAVVDDKGHLQICGPASPAWNAGHGYWTSMNPAGAMDFARWILDTFQEAQP